MKLTGVLLQKMLQKAAIQIVEMDFIVKNSRINNGLNSILLKEMLKTIWRLSHCSCFH